MNASAHPLAGSHAIVTGASRGIGKAIAARLLELGASTTLLGRDERRLRATAAELSSAGDCDWRRCDVTNGAEVASTMAEVQDAHSILSILVNNSGAAASGKFAATELEDWENMLRANLTSTYLCTRASLPALLRGPFGRVVNVASTAGLIGYRYVVAYCAAKHGVIGFTRALALELADTAVTVNSVCPGYTDTELVADAVANIASRTGKSEAQSRAGLVERNPQGRLIDVTEVANAVGWLCLPASRSINGQAISVSGGEVMTG